MSSNFIKADPEHVTQFFSPEIINYLPYHKMYKIQIGGELFLLSGASIASDGPNSYFLDFFQNIEKIESEKNNNINPSNDGNVNVDVQERVLFIDRDPNIFRYIYNHLQGYFINIPNEIVYTKLFADAMYYNLPRLRQQLRESEFYYVNVGGESFKINKSLFKADGNNKNYFKITAEMIYQDIEEFFIKSKEKKFLRPPPQMWSQCGRSPKLLAQLLDLLNNGKFEGSLAERHNLLKECRFYRLLNLEQRLISHRFFTNPFKNISEIFINLFDIKTSDSNIGFTDLDFGLEANINGKAKIDESLEQISKKRKLNSETQLQEITLDDITKKEHTSKDAISMLTCDGKEGFNPVDCEIWNVLSYSRPYVDAWKYPLVFQIGNAIHAEEKPKAVDHCFVSTVKTFNDAGKVIAKPKSSSFLADPDCTVHFGTLLFDADNGCCYISFEGLIALKLFKLLRVFLDETIIQTRYSFQYKNGSNEIVERIVLPCCVKFVVATIDNKSIKNLCGLLKEKAFLRNFEKCQIQNLDTGNSINGYKIPLCDRSVWRLSYKKGENNLKTKDEVIMLAAKIRCGSLREYNNYF
ncbi:hypothetical protein QEN19_001889 [Hanseniaspora menglaensis]